MTMITKYLLMFVVYAFVFMGALFLIDWVSNEQNVWYSYVLQGVLFGIFMTLYNLWTNKGREKKAEIKTRKHRK